MITILIPTVPEREHLLAEAVASVAAQTMPTAHLVGVDHEHHGPAATVNSLASCVQTEWLCRLDDDDVLDPDHAATLSCWLDDGADIVYTWCRLLGDPEHPEDRYQVRLQAEAGWEYLRERNWIPSTAAVRTSLWRELGGLRVPDWTGHEDWDFWVRALDAGARFRCVPTVTWSYRMHADWEHHSQCASS